MRIKFIAFYDLDTFMYENRNNPLSVRNVCDYIIECLIGMGYKVDVISPAETKSEKGFFKKRTTRINKNLTVTLGPSFGSKNKYLKLISVMMTRCWFFLHLLFHTQKDDCIFAWHQIPLMEPVMVFRKLTRNRNLFVLNVGELYQKVIPDKVSDKRKKRELAFIESANGYVLATCGIANYVNIKKRPSIELPGTLRTIPERKSIFDDTKIHILYSGVINKTKGAFEAVDMMEHLDDRYILHILGWGQDANSIKELKKYINQKKGIKNRVFYEGVKTGKDYEDYLLSCHIGLCSQDINAPYNDCSFPSKVLAYLSANLKVVCSNVVAVRESCVSDLIEFTDSNDPRDMAKAVSNISLDDGHDTRLDLEALSKKFCCQLEKMLIKVGINNDR